MELLLSYALPRRDVKPLAKDLLREFGSLKGIMDAERETLEKIRGIGAHAAILFKLIKDTAVLYLKEKAADNLHERTSLLRDLHGRSYRLEILRHISRCAKQDDGYRDHPGRHR